MKRASHKVGRPRSDLVSVEAEAAIREAALTLFAARNFSSVTTKDIAQATGFNTALIYYYFGNKEELFRSAVAMAVERAFDRFRQSRDQAKLPGDLIAHWIDNHIREYDTIAKLIKISIDYASTGKRKASIDRAIRTFYDEERAVLCGALRAGVASGEFDKIDVEETATFISTYLDGVFVRAMILNDFAAVDAINNLKAFLKVRLNPSLPRRSG